MSVDSGRTMNSLRNSTVEIVCQLLVAVLAFICRTVFIKTLSMEYLGVNSLFVNILSVFSLADFGVEVAVTYRLYHSIAEKNERMTRALLRFLRNAFRITAAIIVLLGLLYLAFMDFFIKDTPGIADLPLIFLLYLFSYAEKFFIAYLRPLVVADQKKYIDTLYTTFFLLVQNTIQIMVLIWTRNYILYLIISVVCTLLNNIAISIKAKRLYPYLGVKDDARLDEPERKALFHMLPPLIYRSASGIVTSNTTNIFISAFLGLTPLALYSNYYTLTSLINQFVYYVLKGPIASFGSLNASPDKQKLQSVFEQYQLITFWLYGFSVVCFWTLIDPFIILWIGTDYLMNRTITMVLLMNFYLLGLRHVMNSIKDSTGLFIHFKLKPVFEAAIGIIASLMLVRPFGIEGILLGTTVSQVTTFTADPYIFYKRSFKAKLSRYYKRFFSYIASVVFACITCEYLCSMIQLTNPIFDFLLTFLVTMIIPNFIFAVFYFKTEEFKNVMERMSHISKKIKRNRKARPS